MQKTPWGLAAFQWFLFGFFCAHVLPFRLSGILFALGLWAIIVLPLVMFATKKEWPWNLLVGSSGFMLGILLALEGYCLGDDYDEWRLYSVRSQTQGAGHVSTEPLGGAVVSLDHGHRLVARAVHDV